MKNRPCVCRIFICSIGQNFEFVEESFRVSIFIISCLTFLSKYVFRKKFYQRSVYLLKLNFNFLFRFLETGLYIDFNKIRMKLSELASMQIHALYKKSQGLERNILNDSHRHFFMNKTRQPPQNQQCGRIIPPPIPSMHPPYQMIFHPPSFFQCNTARHFR